MIPPSSSPVPRRRLMAWMALLGLAVAAWSAPLISVRASAGGRTTGDEPHYLLTALSLGEDLDLDVGDERRAIRYRDFHEATLPEQAKVQPGGRRIVPHDPGLPALLALPMRVTGWVGAKAALAAMAGALAALLLWVAVRRLAVPLRPAALSVALFGTSAPLAVYATQVYPEVPAALALTAALAGVTGGGLGAHTTSALAAALLPWLSVKYVPVAGVLAVAVLVRAWRRGSPGRALGLLALLAASALGETAVHRLIYGGWTAYASGSHFAAGEATVVGVDPDYGGRSVRLLGLLVDRGFGLAAWQPAYLLGVAALAALLRRRAAGWVPLVGAVAAGWLTATFLAPTMHGWWWPGRQVVVVLPAVVLAVAWWVGTVAPRARRCLALVGVTGLVSVAVLAVEGLTGGLTLVVDFERTANPLYRVWRLLLPDYRLPGASTWTLHAAWIGGVSALAAWGWRTARPHASIPAVDRPTAATDRVPVTTG